MVICEMLLSEDAEELNTRITDAVRDAVRFAVENEGIQDAEVCVSLVCDCEIRELNLEFRKVDAPTDVLSFPANDVTKPIKEMIAEGFVPEEGEGGGMYLGDVMISIDTAKRQAEEYMNTLQEELCFLAVHGTLHLLGYDHIKPEDEAVMLEKQNVCRQHRLSK